MFLMTVIPERSYRGSRELVTSYGYGYEARFGYVVR